MRWRIIKLTPRPPQAVPLSRLPARSALLPCRGVHRTPAPLELQKVEVTSNDVGAGVYDRPINSEFRIPHYELCIEKGTSRGTLHKEVGCPEWLCISI